ncbi:MAG: DUF6134 family protein [Woeseiaceae bacterium]
MKSSVSLLLLILFASSLLASQETSRNWNFAVYLDDSEIGYHTIRVTDSGDVEVVFSEASFDVRFLFINAFRYRHNNTERWVDGCLQEIDSSTNSNGKQFAVSGAQSEGRFLIETGELATELPQCVMSFAYWNPSFLEQQKLLNPQSGEYLDVAVKDLGEQQIQARGELTLATAYSVEARGMELKVWYSMDNEWLALESLAKGGRTIRYELL